MFYYNFLISVVSGIREGWKEDELKGGRKEGVRSEEDEIRIGKWKQGMEGGIKGASKREIQNEGRKERRRVREGRKNKERKKSNILLHKHLLLFKEKICM